MTHRQFTGWAAWELEQWNTPSRTDHYLMLVATRIQQVLSSKPDKIRLEHQRLEFSQTREKSRGPKNLTPEQAAAMSKARWFSFFGGKKEVRDGGG